MTGVLVVFSLLVAGVGVLLLSQATAGVGVLAGAILLAIYARIYQAHEQHRTFPHVREQAARVKELESAYLNAPPRKPTAFERYAVVGFFVFLGLLIVAAIVQTLFFP
jgi:hypothetical protein